MTSLANSPIEIVSSYNVFFCRYLKMRPGEKLVDRLDAIEDTKGNNGDRGTADNIIMDKGVIRQTGGMWM